MSWALPFQKSKFSQTSFSPHFQPPILSYHSQSLEYFDKNPDSKLKKFTSVQRDGLLKGYTESIRKLVQETKDLYSNERIKEVFPDFDCKFYVLSMETNYKKFESIQWNKALHVLA